MSDSEFFTIEDGSRPAGAAQLQQTAEYPNYEEALKAVQGAASDNVGPLLIVRWTRTEMTRAWREITVKSEDVTKASSDAKPL